MMTRSISLTSARPAGSAGATLRQVWAALSEMMRRRQTRRLLLEMDDRMLADVGIGRGDALAEAGRPFWVTGRPLD